MLHICLHFLLNKHGMPCLGTRKFGVLLFGAVRLRFERSELLPAQKVYSCANDVRKAHGSAFSDIFIVQL